MSWGGLNAALTAWRTAIVNLFDERSDASDGGYADSNHGSNSQHQPDSDGTVDAYDMDNNLMGDSTATGSDRERKLLEKLKLDFEQDAYGRGHLWISHREIARHDHGWSENYYGGSNAHDQHTHWEARQDREDDGRVWKLPNTESLLRSWGYMITKDDVQKAVVAALQSDAGQDAVGEAAGRGTHNQEVGRSDKSIGAHLEMTLAAVERIEDHLTSEPV